MAGQETQSLAALCYPHPAQTMFQFQPMPLLKLAAPFDDPDWVFELKYDGFRALALIEPDRAQLISRNGNQFASFADLAADIRNSISSTHLAVLDGEIVCMDKKGKPQFRDLLFRRHDPCFFAFDLLMHDGKDCRQESLLDRKQQLRRLLARISPPFPVRYAEYVEVLGTALFQRICKLDLEGIVAKQKHAPYTPHRESTWFKIRNRNYSQWAGREELFERDRRHEPVAGWHTCVIASESADSGLKETN